jgi:predicted Na+-dependent transporter
MASIPGQKLLTSLSLKVLLPLGIGQAARACHPVRCWARKQKGQLSRASESLLLLTVYATFVSTFAKVR